jgi:hypothetical protein
MTPLGSMKQVNSSSYQPLTWQSGEHKACLVASGRDRGFAGRGARRRADCMSRPEEMTIQEAILPRHVADRAVQEGNGQTLGRSPASTTAVRRLFLTSTGAKCGALNLKITAR